MQPAIRIEDGGFQHKYGVANCAGVFKNHECSAIGAFFVNLSVLNLGKHGDVYAEVMGMIKAIELVSEKCWYGLIFESDSIESISYSQEEGKNPSADIKQKLMTYK